jgi:hypothetical protein
MHSVATPKAASPAEPRKHFGAERSHPSAIEARAPARPHPDWPAEERLSPGLEPMRL